MVSCFRRTIVEIDSKAFQRLVLKILIILRISKVGAELISK